MMRRKKKGKEEKQLVSRSIHHHLQKAMLYHGHVGHQNYQKCVTVQILMDPTVFLLMLLSNIDSKLQRDLLDEHFQWPGCSQSAVSVLLFI